MRTALRIGTILVATAGALGLAAPAAQAYPDRPVEMIVPFPPGGSTDIVGRIVAEALSQRLGQPVVVDNRGGAGGTVGTEALARTESDGYALGIASTSTHVIGPLVHDVGYDPQADFAPIGLVAETPYVLVVNPELPATTVEELVAYAKERPGELNYGSAGIGSTTHLAAEMFKMAAELDMEHIPYSGNAPATTALMGGEIELLVGSLPAVLSQIQAGTIRALAVGTASRSPELPEVPTMQEAGIAGYEASLWLGVVAPAGADDEIVKQLHDAVVDLVGDSTVQQQLRSNGAEPQSSTPEEFAARIAADIEKYAEIVAMTEAAAD